MKSVLKISSLMLFAIVVACSGSDDTPSCTEQIWYLDADDDGFGNASVTLNSCTQPIGYVSDSTDCDDNDANNNPGAQEQPDGIDNNCNGLVDECDTDANCGGNELCINGNCETSTTYYADDDADGFGDSSDSVTAGNNAPTGYVLDNTDCDDSNPDTYPGANENTSDGIDNDCDGFVDETSICGNGIIEDGEACDDGNLVPNDGCFNCQNE